MLDRISFACGAPAPELLPLEELADCAETVLRRDGRTILSYGAAAGYTPLRARIADWFGVHPARVVVTNGSLQALGLLAARLAAGQPIVAEWPTYDRAYRTFLDARSALLGAAADGGGLVPDEVPVALTGQPPAAFLYVIPTFQNPTGATLTLERRHELLRIAARRELLIVEDDPYSLLRLDGEPLPALFDLSGGETIYVSSFSATIAPGLRVGWTILPERFADGIAEAAADAYITPVLLAQATVHELLARGGFEPALRRLVEGLRVRRDALTAALGKHLGDAAHWTVPDGGFFLWLELPAGVSAREVLARAEGVEAASGLDFNAPANCLRLAYGLAAPDEIDEGVRRLAAALA